MLFNWVMAGYKPILAHPERNLKIAEIPTYAYKFCQMGVFLQMNGGSLLGIFGERAKKTGHLLMDHDMIHFIASDGHNVDTRPIYLGDVYDYVVDNWGKERADELMYENPRKAILGKAIQARDPIPISENSHKPNKIRNLLKKLGLK